MTASHRWLALALVLACPLTAQISPLDRAKQPFAAVADAARLRNTMKLRELRSFVEARINDPAPQSAASYFLTAELLEQLGDERAGELFEQAIRTDPAESAYELFYADYLRNFLGAGHPSFADAEDHYYAALRKLAQADGSPGEAEEIRRMLFDRIDRGLVTLYQEDGVPLRWSDSGRPVLFLGSIHRFARSTADLDEVHDARDFTAEALFASSPARLGRPLSTEELRRIARLKRPADDFERVRFRAEGAAIDVFYQRRDIDDAQITNFFQPNAFNAVKLQSAGVGAEMSGDHAFARIAYSLTRRVGVVEFLPRTNERIEQVATNAGFSTFTGPDKMSLNLVYVAQAIKPDMDDPPERERNIIGATADYDLLRPLPFLRDVHGQLFGLRGVHLSGGFAHDGERYGDVWVTRRDIFVGVAVGGLGPFDVAAQRALIDTHVSNDSSQKSSQFRTDATLVVRLLDEERQPGIPRHALFGFYPAFVNLVLPIRRDEARQGLDAFENKKSGAALNVKLFRRALTGTPAAALRATPTTVLLSVRYDRQRFTRLDKSVPQLAVSASLGY